MKTASEILKKWEDSLDAIDKEIVAKVTVSSDDDYPFELRGVLSPAAKERAGQHHTEVGWTVSFCPTPPTSYFKALEEEKATARNATTTRHLSAEEERNRWVKEHLAGFVPTEYDEFLPNDDALEDVRFDTHHFGTNDAYRRYEIAGKTIWKHSYGNTWVIYMPSDQALYKKDDDEDEDGGYF